MFLGCGQQGGKCYNQGYIVPLRGHTGVIVLALLQVAQKGSDLLFWLGDYGGWECESVLTGWSTG